MIASGRGRTHRNGALREESFCSFFRTITVGIGIAPILLTVRNAHALVDFNHRWGFSPRPETSRDSTAF